LGKPIDGHASGLTGPDLRLYIAPGIRTDHECLSPGSPLRASFMTLAFMALPVIPDLKLTDRGLFELSKFQQR
jgi:adenine deaminase